MLQHSMYYLQLKYLLGTKKILLIKYMGTGPNIKRDSMDKKTAQHNIQKRD